ncbi:MAG: amidohydrolase family protein [Candidatus Caldarchaeum sp.]
MYELVVKNARLRGHEGALNLGVDGGRIVRIASEDLSGEEVIDANGNLVTEPFVNPHLHLCKVYTLAKIGDKALSLYQEKNMRKAAAAVKIASEVKKAYREDVIYENAKLALFEAVRYGCLYLRAFVDTDTIAKHTAVRAVLRLKREFEKFLTVQVVAFPQEGIVKDFGAADIVWKAVEQGCDVVGGIPWIEDSTRDARIHVQKIFEIAREFDKDVAFLTDDCGNSASKTTELVAVTAIQHRWNGRATVHHARAMSLYGEKYLNKVIQLLRKASITVVLNPHTGPLHAPVHKLCENGVNVALGQDDIADAYYPFGRNKMLEIAFLASHFFRTMTMDSFDKIFNMITVNPAKSMRLKNYGIKPGSEASFVIHDAKTVYEAIWHQAGPRYVFSQGTLVYEKHVDERWHLPL